MKTILLTTDFSKAAHNSCSYGIELARAFNARVILFSAYQQVPMVISESAVVITADNMEAFLQRQLANEANLVNRAGIVTLETVCMEGSPANSILKIAKENNADIIVTGMKESGKGFRRVMGSTVTALAGKTTIPLLVIPEEARYGGLNSIALANESDIDADADIHLLDALREIGEKFQSRLYLLRIARNKFHEKYEALNRPFRLARALRTLAPVYKCIGGKGIEQAFNDFVAGYQVNMLALLPHKYSLMERWFIKSTTRSMIFATHIPLLILPEQGMEETIQEQSERRVSQ